MDTRYLQSFVAVVELGSMAEAARRLDLTPAAIAARVKALELDIGASLVRRSGRSVRPTETGLRMLDRARNLLREVRDLRAAADDGVSLGELRMGVFASAMTGVLPPVLKRLYDKYPALSVFVAPGSSVELCRQVATGALDAAVVVEPQFTMGKGCAWSLLIEERLVVVAPKGLKDRSAHDLLTHDRSSDTTARSSAGSWRTAICATRASSCGSAWRSTVSWPSLRSWARAWASPCFPTGLLCGTAGSSSLGSRCPNARLSVAWASCGPSRGLARRWRRLSWSKRRPSTADNNKFVVYRSIRRVVMAGLIGTLLFRRFHHEESKRP